VVVGKTDAGGRVGEEVVEVTIRPDGKVEMRVEGVPGLHCLEVTGELARLLGGEIETQQLTAEAYQEVDETQQERLWH
jgi:hypothetical protein